MAASGPHDQVTPIPGALVLQLPAQLGPCRIADRPRQGMVGGHAPHMQVLDHDRLVLTDEPSRQLVQMVAATVSNPACTLATLIRALSRFLEPHCL
jgi:hypothetical protein